MGNFIEELKEKAKDEAYLKKLGIQVLEVKEGYALVEMPLSEELKNIHGLVHGGAIFSLIDAAFELASNSHGVTALALNMNITFHQAPPIAGYLKAEAKEIHLSKRLGSYFIQAFDQDGNLIATCQALVYRKG